MLIRGATRAYFLRVIFLQELFIDDLFTLSGFQRIFILKYRQSIICFEKNYTNHRCDVEWFILEKNISDQQKNDFNVELKFLLP